MSVQFKALKGVVAAESCNTIATKKESEERIPKLEVPIPY